MSSIFSTYVKWVALFFGNMILLVWVCWEPGWSSAMTLISSLFFTILFNISDLIPRGAEYSIPYLQMFDDFSHTIVINNLDKISCEYEFIFVPIGGVSAVPSDKVKGVVQSESCQTFLASQLLTLTGASKIASLLKIYPDSASVPSDFKKEKFINGLF